MTIEDLKNAHREYFAFLHMTDSDFERVLKAGPPKLRLGKKSVEMLVRHYNGETEWAPLNIQTNSNHKDYTPEISSAGSKHSRKSKPVTKVTEPDWMI